MPGLVSFKWCFQGSLKSMHIVHRQWGDLPVGCEEVGLLTPRGQGFHVRHIVSTEAKDLQANSGSTEYMLCDLW